MASDLRSYLADLGGYLNRVQAEVDPITQVGALCSESDYPVLFENLRGFPDWKLTDILVKDRTTQAIALGCAPDQVVQHLARVIYERGPADTKVLDTGPCKEVRLIGEEADIRKLPIPIHSVGDGGRYLGSGLTITMDPDTGVRNESIIRTHVRDDEPRRVGFWMAARHNWAHYAKYEARNEPMPMAYAVGVHPAYDIIANYSGPHPGFDELQLGASILGETLELVKCESHDLLVPANAELIIEGFVPPHVREAEGPFGEFTNFQGGKTGNAPVMEITAITHRRDPIFRHMQATSFTDHQALIAPPYEAALYQRLRDVQGGLQIHDVYVPPWASLFVVVIQMTAKWDGQAQAAGMAALSGVNLHPKIVIVVDEDVDIYNANEIIWAMSTRMDPQHDVLVIPNERIHPLDQSVAPTGDDVTVFRKGGKMIMDATKPAQWRGAKRDEFRRVDPQGTGDVTLEAVFESIRKFVPNEA